jgi:hypothetical protein
MGIISASWYYSSAKMHKVRSMAARKLTLDAAAVPQRGRVFFVGQRATIERLHEALGQNLISARGCWVEERAAAPSEASGRKCVSAFLLRAHHLWRADPVTVGG